MEKEKKLKNSIREKLKKNTFYECGHKDQILDVGTLYLCMNCVKILLGEEMTKLEDVGNSIEDLIKAFKSIEDNGLYTPYNGKFPISKEMYNYLMEPHKFRWGSPRGLNKLLEDEKDD